MKNRVDETSYCIYLLLKENNKIFVVYVHKNNGDLSLDIIRDHTSYPKRKEKNYYYCDESG